MEELTRTTFSDFHGCGVQTALANLIALSSPARQLVDSSASFGTGSYIGDPELTNRTGHGRFITLGC